MSKKLLKESTIRRFGGLAGIRPATTSNFLSEFDETAYKREEEEVEAEEEIEMAPEEDIEEEEVELDIEEEPVEDSGADAEGLVMSLLDKVKEWAVDQGVEMDVEGDDAGEEIELGASEEELDMEMGDEELDMEMGDEETLEEMINSMLSEEEEVVEEGGGDSTGDCADGGDCEDKDYVGKKNPQNETIEIIDDEKVIQEVTKRVKQRLIKIAKTQRQNKQ